MSGKSPTPTTPRRIMVIAAASFTPAWILSNLPLLLSMTNKTTGQSIFRHRLLAWLLGTAESAPFPFQSFTAIQRWVVVTASPTSSTTATLIYPTWTKNKGGTIWNKSWDTTTSGLMAVSSPELRRISDRSNLPMNGVPMHLSTTIKRGQPWKLHQMVPSKRRKLQPALSLLRDVRRRANCRILQDGCWSNQRSKNASWLCNIKNNKT